MKKIIRGSATAANTHVKSKNPPVVYQQKQRSETFCIPLTPLGITEDGREFNIDSLKSRLDDLTGVTDQENVFKQISIPVYMRRGDCSDDKTKKGYSAVGFIRGFDGQNLTVVVYPTYTKYVKDMTEPTTFVRARVDMESGNIGTILGLDIAEKSLYLVDEDDETDSDEVEQ